MTPSRTPEDLLKKLNQWFIDSEDYFSLANARASRDRDYVDGRQWTAEEMAARDEDEKATLCMNHIAPKIRFLVGLDGESRTDPKAWPRNQEADEASADAATAGLRYVADANDLHSRLNDGYENLLIEGIEAYDITAKRCPDGAIDPLVVRLPWDRLFYDPFSREKDFSDARYLGSVTWTDQDEALFLWPEAEDVIRQTFSGASSSPYEDRPNWTAGTQRDRARVFQIYWREQGKWQHAKFTEAGFVEPPGPSPWLDEYGQPECAIIAGSALINNDNERYGAVREMIDPQDEINKRHSDAISFLTARQTWGDAGAVKDVNEAKREWAKPRGHTQITPGLRFDVFPTTDLTTGNLEALRLAREEIDQRGPNASMLGKRDKAESGRAIIAQQEGGKMEIAVFGKAHTDLKKRIYRALWHRIRQFWTGPKWIRVTDDEQKVSALGLNQPVTYRQAIAQQNGGVVPPDVEARFGPALDGVSHVQNQIGMLDVDIILDETYHSPAAQLEQFEQLTNLALQGAKMGAPLPFKAIIQASTLRNKDKLLAAIEQEQQAAQQAQQQQMAAMAAKVQADTQKTQAEAMRAAEEAQQTRLENMMLAMQAQMQALLARIPMQQGPMMPMQQDSIPPGVMPGPPMPPPGAGLPPAMGVPPGAAPIPMQPPPPGVPPGVEVMQ